jgi:hypothetical protein
LIASRPRSARRDDKTISKMVIRPQFAADRADSLLCVRNRCHETGSPCALVIF